MDALVWCNRSNFSIILVLLLVLGFCENEDDDEDDLLTKQPRLMAEKGLIKFARASHFSPTPVGAGIGTWPPRTRSEPVAVASSGQSLSHSA